MRHSCRRSIRESPGALITEKPNIYKYVNFGAAVACNTLQLLHAQCPVIAVELVCLMWGLLDLRCLVSFSPNALLGRPKSRCNARQPGNCGTSSTGRREKTLEHSVPDVFVRQQLEAISSCFSDVLLGRPLCAEGRPVCTRGDSRSHAIHERSNSLLKRLMICLLQLSAVSQRRGQVVIKCLTVRWLHSTMCYSLLPQVRASTSPRPVFVFVASLCT